jgi:hypothetical protein
MLKDVVSKLDYSVFDEIALVIFALCFGAICLWALTLRRSTVDRFSDRVDARPIFFRHPPTWIPPPPPTPTPQPTAACPVPGTP